MEQPTIYELFKVVGFGRFPSGVQEFQAWVVADSDTEAERLASMVMQMEHNESDIVVVGSLYLGTSYAVRENVLIAYELRYYGTKWYSEEVGADILEKLRTGQADPPPE